MKLICLLLSLSVALADRAADAPPTNSLPETHIKSDSVEFDMKQRLAIYTGNVRVTDPRITLTCEYLTAFVPENGRVESIVAETNVVGLIVTNGTTFTVTAAKAVYTYQTLPVVTNQTLELAGMPEPKITWPQEEKGQWRTNEFAARRIVWDLGRNRMKADEHRGVFPDLGNFRRNLPVPVAPTNVPPSTP